MPIGFFNRDHCSASQKRYAFNFIQNIFMSANDIDHPRAILKNSFNKSQFCQLKGLTLSQITIVQGLDSRLTMNDQQLLSFFTAPNNILPADSNGILSTQISCHPVAVIFANFPPVPSLDRFHTSQHSAKPIAINLTHISILTIAITVTQKINIPSAISEPFS
jgi:hypothetical protein